MTTEPTTQEDDGLIDIDIIGLAKEPGWMDTIVQFVGKRRDNSTLVIVGVDHRPAHDITAALCDEDEVFVRCEGWQLAGVLPEDFNVLHPSWR